MTPLPATVRKAGFELTRIERVGRVAIYRQHLPGADADHDAYEVILLQVRNTNHKGELVEPYEGYPAAESWGKKGWTFTGLAKAVQKLKELAQKASPTGTVSCRNRWDRQRRRWDGQRRTWEQAHSKRLTAGAWDKAFFAARWTKVARVGAAEGKAFLD